LAAPAIRWRSNKLGCTLLHYAEHHPEFRTRLRNSVRPIRKSPLRLSLLPELRSRAHPQLHARAGSLSIGLRCSSRMSDSNVARMLTGPNPLHPDHMTATERLGEVAAILAVGLVRLLTPKSSELSAEAGESSLHFSPDQSGHALRKSHRSAR
jgi:hypothetical protein